jgi:hypothetical protein
MSNIENLLNIIKILYERKKAITDNNDDYIIIAIPTNQIP